MAFNEMKPRFADLPYRSWLYLSGIAIGGSMIYGASLSLVVQRWHFGASAMLLTFAAGLAWCVFVPIIVMATKMNVFAVTHACLVTMAYGEAVLALGAVINVLLSSSQVFRVVDGVTFNAAWVLLTNIIMLMALAIQLAAVKIPYWKTALLWMVALNGSGYLFFIVFKQFLEK